MTLSRYCQSDIMLELIELCQDLVRDLRQELGYFRVSAYKQEASQAIELRMTKLKSVICVFGDNNLDEAFNDDFGIANTIDFQPLPGECRLSTRASILLNTIDLGLKRLNAKLGEEQSSESTVKISEAIKAKKNDILSLCPEGTRQHLIFQAL